MKVYLFFVEKEALYEAIGSHLALFSYYKEFIAGKEFLLYAYTNQKNYYLQFKKLHRNDLFRVITKDISEDEYNDLKSEFKNQLLSDYQYTDGKNEVSIISTAIEYEESRHGALSIIEDQAENLFSMLPYFFIDSLKDKYRDALITLGLNSLITVVDEQFEGYEEFSPHDEYIISIPSTKEDALGKKISVMLNIKSKSLNCYINFFNGILARDKKEEI